MLAKLMTTVHLALLTVGSFPSLTTEVSALPQCSHISLFKYL